MRGWRRAAQASGAKRWLAFSPWHREHEKGPRQRRRAVPGREKHRRQYGGIPRMACTSWTAGQGTPSGWPGGRPASSRALSVSGPNTPQRVNMAPGRLLERFDGRRAAGGRTGRPPRQWLIRLRNHRLHGSDHLGRRPTRRPPTPPPVRGYPPGVVSGQGRGWRARGAILGWVYTKTLVQVCP